MLAGCGAVAAPDLAEKLQNAKGSAQDEEDSEEEDAGEDTVKKETKKKSKKKKKKPAEDADKNIDPETAYQPVFDEILEIIEYGYNMDREYDYASGELTQKIDLGEKENLLDEIGYHYEDISGDGIPELLVGYDADYLQNGGESYIAGIYTLKDGKPYTTYAGSSRSGYMRMDDSHFFYTGNNGTSFTVMGKNHLSEDGTEIVWDDCYFTDEDENGHIVFYHNKSGVIDADESEEMDITDEDFYEIMDDCAYSCIMIGWTPLRDLAGGSAEGGSADAGTNAQTDLPKDMQKKLNLFLSNFAEQRMSYFNGDDRDMYEIGQFAYMWTYINKGSDVKTEGSNYTVSFDTVKKLADKYLGIEISKNDLKNYSSPDYKYQGFFKNGNYYIPAADGESYTSIAVVTSVEEEGDDLLRAEFAVFDVDTDLYFDNDEKIPKEFYSYSFNEATASSDLTQIDNGYAIVRKDGDSYKLNLYELYR